MTDTAFFRPCRSVLYVPAVNARALEKAKALNVDTLILDLEDSIAPGEKRAARRQLAQSLSVGGFGNREIVIRINDLKGPWGADDLALAAAAMPDAVLLPKVNDVGDISEARAAFTACGGGAHIPLWAMVETPLCLLNLQQIGAWARPQNLRCLVMGCNDLAKETRASLTHGRWALLPWLSQSVLVAKAYGLDILDGVYNDFTDLAGFTAEGHQARALGMDGKTLIHPNQIARCNEIFSPTPEELEEANRIVATFSLPENEGKGVLTIDGKMVERLHLTMAERLAAISHAISQR